MTPATSIRKVFRVPVATLEIKAQLKGAHGILEVSAFPLPVL